jgi:hypothetical protein
MFVLLTIRRHWPTKYFTFNVSQSLPTAIGCRQFEKILNGSAIQRVHCFMTLLRKLAAGTGAGRK